MGTESYVLGYAGAHLALNDDAKFVTMFKPVMYGGAFPEVLLSKCRLAATKRAQYQALLTSISAVVKREKAVTCVWQNPPGGPGGGRNSSGGRGRNSGTNYTGGSGTGGGFTWSPWRANLRLPWPEAKGGSLDYGTLKVLKGYITKKLASAALPAGVCACDTKCLLAHASGKTCDIHMFPAFRVPWFKAMWKAARQAGMINVSEEVEWNRRRGSTDAHKCGADGKSVTNAEWHHLQDGTPGGPDQH